MAIIVLAFQARCSSVVLFSFGKSGKTNLDKPRSGETKIATSETCGIHVTVKQNPDKGSTPFPINLTTIIVLAF